MKYPTVFICLVLMSFASSAVQAVDGCGIKVDNGSGAVQVSAWGVVGALSWGDVEGHEINAFQNGSACTRGNVAKDCELGPPGTLKQIIHPGRCQVWVADESGLNSCSARLKGCTPDQTPVGSIAPFAGTAESVPLGWLLVDGSSVSRVVFADLFTVLGSSHGAGDGSETFNLPDYRGRFIRGVDGGTGRDPDSLSRQTMNTGGNSGALVGSIQLAATAMPNEALNLTQAGIHAHGMDYGGNHKHTYTDSWLSTGFKPVLGLTDGPWRVALGGNHYLDRDTSYSGVHKHLIRSSGPHSHTIEGGDLETRPENAYVNWIIKY